MGRKKKMIKTFGIGLVLTCILPSVGHSQKSPAAAFTPYEDFKLDMASLVGSMVKIDVPVGSVDVVAGEVHVDHQYLALNIKFLERKKKKEIDNKCGENGGYCRLKVSGILQKNPLLAPVFVLKPESLSVHFLVGIAVSEGGAWSVNLTEQLALADNANRAPGEVNVSDQFWLEGDGNISVFYATGLTEFYAGWHFDKDPVRAKATASKICNDNISPANKLLVKCSEIGILKFPWW
jgi:hypothetical protein